MFQKGVTTAEIAHLMESMYGHHYTPQTISNMTKVLSEQVEATAFPSSSHAHVSEVSIWGNLTGWENEDLF
ncbi:transposase-like protein [Priestia megaterium]|nr:transposase-like protein [Priestia megaterium]